MLIFRKSAKKPILVFNEQVVEVMDREQSQTIAIGQDLEKTGRKHDK